MRRSSSPTSARSGKSAATSRAFAPSSGRRPENERDSQYRNKRAGNRARKEPAQAGRPRGEQQDAEDRGGAGRAAREARGVRQDRHPLEQIPRPCGQRRVPGGRPGGNRRMPADLENQGLDRHAACREVQSRLKLTAFRPRTGSKTERQRSRLSAQVGWSEEP